ncbi:response regulator [uncultured Methanospirillum sp.]|uniref:PAS domain-containing response regulator n=1 Tax=uncultured Methanospirillum sp. TaxID=262503 RepID=UPI0029C99509|nr:response regulator [uncultured Methanospirillum sp.]
MITNIPQSDTITTLHSDQSSQTPAFHPDLPPELSLPLSNLSGVCTVLVVDDEPLFLDLTRRYLERIGYIQTICCNSAVEACSKIHDPEIDVIVSDYDMPGMNGIQYLSWLRESGCHIPFILCTGRGREEVVIEALNCGASYYIGKGCDPKPMYAELCNVIRQISSNIRSEKAIREKEHLIGSIFQHLPDPTYAVDLSGKVIAWNRAMEELTGISRLQAEGTNINHSSLPYIHAQTGLPIEMVLGLRVDLPDPFVLLLQTPGMVMSEISVVNEDLNTAVYWVKTTSLRSESGYLIGAIETIRDVTSEKKTEHDLRAKSQYHRSLVETHIDPLITLDEDLVISDLNLAAEEVIGDLRENIMGTPFPHLFQESNFVGKACTRIMHQSMQIRDVSLGLITKEGIKQVLLFAVPCTGDLLPGVRIFVELHEKPFSGTGRGDSVSGS